MVITVEIYQQIRKFHLEGKSQRQIAKILGISRNTVKKYWEGEAVPWERKDYPIRKARVITNNVELFIKSCFKEDEVLNLKKQKHTAQRIYDRLVEEHNFQGSSSSVRRAVNRIRDKTTIAYVPLSFPIADALQVDWGEATIHLNGQKTKINLFCAKLCYSNAPFVVAYLRQNEESFLEAFTQAFQYFGGVPRKVIFDNAKVAVKEGFGSQAKKQAGYAALAAHYGFEAVFCNVASGNEKGLVEGLVGYIRRNALVPIPQVKTLDELNKLLREKCEQYLNRTIKGKSESVQELFYKEKQALYPLPKYVFETSKKSLTRVNRFATVRFESNNYSVPIKFCAKEVTIKASPHSIKILYENVIIAEHTRSYEKNKDIYILEHYLSLLTIKGRAIFYAKPIQNSLPIKFYNWLSSQNFSPKEVIEIIYRYLEEGDENLENIMLGRKKIEAINAKNADQLSENIDISLYDKLLTQKVV